MPCGNLDAEWGKYDKNSNPFLAGVFGATEARTRRASAGVLAQGGGGEHARVAASKRGGAVAVVCFCARDGERASPLEPRSLAGGDARVGVGGGVVRRLRPLTARSGRTRVLAGGGCSSRESGDAGAPLTEEEVELDKMQRRRENMKRRLDEAIEARDESTATKLLTRLR